MSSPLGVRIYGGTPSTQKRITTPHITFQCAQIILTSSCLLLYSHSRVRFGDLTEMTIYSKSYEPISKIIAWRRHWRFVFLSFSRFRIGRVFTRHKWQQMSVYLFTSPRGPCLSSGTCRRLAIRTGEWFRALQSYPGPNINSNEIELITTKNFCNRKKL